MKLQKLAPFMFTPPAAASEDKPPRFLLRPLTGLEYQEIFSSASMERDSEGRPVVRAPSDSIRRILRTVLQGWENIFEDDGSEAIFRPDRPDSSFSRLPVLVLNELAAEVIRRSTLDETEKKTS